MQGTLPLQGVLCRCSSLKAAFWRICCLLGSCGVLQSIFPVNKVNIPWQWAGDLTFSFPGGELCQELMFASVLKEEIAAVPVQSWQEQTRVSDTCWNSWKANTGAARGELLMCALKVALCQAALGSEQAGQQRRALVQAKVSSAERLHGFGV